MKKVFLIGFIGLVLGLGLVFTGQVQAWLEVVGINGIGVKPVNTQVISPIFTEPDILGIETSEEPEPSPQSAGLPVRLVIKRINVDAEIEQVGLDDQQRMDVPKLDENVGWYKYGAKPGEKGSSVLAGHYDSKAGTPAVFYDLTQVIVGDEIQVYDEAGQVKTFIVTETALYPDSTFPLDRVFGTTGKQALQLITCAGVFDQQAKNYEDRLVVYSVLKP